MPAVYSQSDIITNIRKKIKKTLFLEILDLMNENLPISTVSFDCKNCITTVVIDSEHHESSLYKQIISEIDKDCIIIYADNKKDVYVNDVEEKEEEEDDTGKLWNLFTQEFAYTRS